MLGQYYTHANFSVDDLAEAKEFYIDTLGFHVKKEFEGVLVIESDQGTRAVIYEKPDHEPWNSTVFGIETDDVRAAVNELADNGIDMEQLEGTDEFGILSDPVVGDAAWFKDPAGNWICINTVLKTD